MAKIKVGLVQINNGFSGQHYLPYSVGMLEAHARAHLTDPQRYEFLLPLFRRIGVSEAVEHLAGCTVVGFSLYVWNEQLSLAIARELKKVSPETLIVFGGPQVPDRVEPFLRKNDFVDVAVHGEGEDTFLQILENPTRSALPSIEGISYMNRGLLASNPRRKRIGDLSRIPSPYLSGVFEPLMSSFPSKWIAIWETNRGCPFQCTFCDWGSATATRVYEWDMPRVRQEVEWFSRNKIGYVFTADANFGILERDEQIAQYCAEVKASTGFPARLSVQSTKSGKLGSRLTERAFQVQKILSDSGLNQGVVVSMQSIDADTLVAIKRSNISTDAFREIQRRFTAAGVETMTDLILALPGETYQSFADGVSELIEGGQHNRIQFNNLGILPNAEMGDPDYQHKFGMEIVQSRIINIHGFRDNSAEDIDEYQKLVVATNTMPREDWVKTRIFAWASAFLHFDKILQIALIATHSMTDIPYRALIEAFTNTSLSSSEYPVLARIKQLFEAKACDIQAGGEEYCYSKEWLGIWWPADEYAFIDLVSRGDLDAFYEEAYRLLLETSTGKPIDASVLKDAIAVNKELLKKPNVDGKVQVETDWNILDYHREILCGLNSVPVAGRHVTVIDRDAEQWRTFEDWCREVVWYGNKRGAYLYGNASVTQIAGHF